MVNPHVRSEDQENIGDGFSDSSGTDLQAYSHNLTEGRIHDGLR